MTTTTAAEPIRATWKVNQVLQRYPQLLEVFIATDPAFSKLRNPVLRRVQSRLVTVEQAARIAGVDPLALVRTLNDHLGLETADDTAGPTNAPAASQNTPEWVGTAAIAVELDVREFQRRGEEPFGAIMEAIRQVPQGRALALRNTFEPVPLYDVLALRGFEHWARQDAADDWQMLFYNTGRPRQAAQPPPSEPADTTPPLDWQTPSATVTIDVSELVPPEPLVRILEALEDLPAGGSLLVHHLRRPMHLYPRLDELGYRHETREIAPNRVELLIEKTGEREGDTR